MIIRSALAALYPLLFFGFYDLTEEESNQFGFWKGVAGIGMALTMIIIWSVILKIRSVEELHSIAARRKYGAMYSSVKVIDVTATKAKTFN